ncbi:GPP34 family phosphoprotein [Nonomuraea sp. NPDC046570]|uniref:GOLPH3/VPS74 family protein n=1 Tax=Nonomuraea sp. NPDC046570 TaxID=3155255 RepID=UPI00340A1488
MDRLPLYQDLFLMSHHESGKPLIHRPSMALGLAGAVLVELALSDRVTVVQGRATVTDRTRTGDPIIDGLATLILRDRANRDVTYWIKKVADDVYDRTRHQLVASGVLVPVTSRLLGMLPYTRYQLADLASVVRASARVRFAVEGWREADALSAALCGLVAVLQVEGELYLDQPSSQLIGRLRAIAAEHSPVVKELVGIVDALVGEAAVAVYR